MAGRVRKRSAAITLVLAGGLAGCGGEPIPQQDAYRNLDDCVRDWGSAAQCQPVRDGRYASSYHYGPAYYGSRYGDGRPRPSPNAMDVLDRPKGTPVSSLTSSRSSGGSSSTSSWFRGGSSSSSTSSSSSSSHSSSSSSSARSGFGSSASSHGSSS